MKISAIAKTGSGRTLIPVKYLLVYFVRVVIGRGALRKPTVRNSLAILILLAYVLLVFFFTHILGNDEIDPDILDYMFVLLSSNIILCACLGVTAIKALVGTAANIAAVLDYLPAARYERGRAYAVVELLLIFIVAFAFSGIILSALFVMHGFTVFGLFVSCIFLPLISVVFVAVVFSRLLEFLLSRTPFKAFVTPIIACIFFVITLLVYRYFNNPFNMISMSELEQEHPWYLFYHYLYSELNDFWFYAFALFLTVALFSLLLLSPTPIPAKRTIYTSFPLGNLVTRLRFGMNLTQLIRHRTFTEGLLFCVIIAVYIALSQGTWSLNIALEPLVIVGLYHFANINVFVSTTRPYLSNVSYYLSMLSGLLGMVLVPMVCLSLLDLVRVLVFQHSLTLTTWTFTVLGVCVTAIVTLSIGILLPTYDDNPFSVCLGLGVFLALLYLVVLVTSLLDLSTLMTIVTGICCVVVIVWLSIEGIKLNRKAS